MHQFKSIKKEKKTATLELTKYDCISIIYGNFWEIFYSEIK